MRPQIEQTQLTCSGTSNGATASIKETGYGFTLLYAVTLHVVFQCVSMHSTNNVQNSAQLCLTVFVVQEPAGVHKVIIRETKIIKISVFKIG